MMVRLWFLALGAYGVLAQILAPVVGEHVDFHVPPPLQAADAADCAAAIAAVTVCARQPGFTAAPQLSQAACVCCDGTSNISPVFGDCAAYIATASPSETVFFTENLIISSVCRSAGSAVCGAGGSGAATPTFPPGATTTPTTAPRTTSSPTQRTYPPACTSMDSMIASCLRATPDFTDRPATEQASCLCYTSKGSSFTTAFDRFATTCVSYVKTAVPATYTRISAWTTFCERRSPEPTDPAGPTAFPTTTPRTTPRTTTTTDPNRPFTTRTSSAPAVQVVPSGPVSWMAQTLSAVLSFLFLV